MDKLQNAVVAVWEFFHKHDIDLLLGMEDCNQHLNYFN